MDVLSELYCNSIIIIIQGGGGEPVQRPRADDGGEDVAVARHCGHQQARALREPTVRNYVLLLPNHQWWYAIWKLGRNIHASHARFCTFGVNFVCSVGA